jgi:hypothetical protein
VEVVCIKVGGTNVKTCNEFDNHPIKMWSKHKIKIKVDYRMKSIRIVFLSSKL